MKNTLLPSRGSARLLLLGACCAGGLWLTGCGTPSAWDRSLERGPDTSPAAMARGTATIRRVPWERVQQTLVDLEHDIATSDVHPDEWTAAQNLAAKGKLLRGLQVSQDPASVLILGRTQFRTTDNMNDADANLLRIAQKLGADLVVYSSRVLGKADTVIDKPVTTTTWGTGWFRGSDGSNRPDTYSETSTSWVPVRVSLDETGAIAYFLKSGK